MKSIFGKCRREKTSVIRIATVFAIALSMILSFGAVSSYADESGIETTQKPTLKQLRDKYNDVGTPPMGEATFSTPVNTSTYTPATLTNASLTFAKKYINYMRYQAGIGEITLDNSVNANAAQGALILAKLNSGLSHSPSVPSDVTPTAAAPGQYAAAASNLSYSSAWPNPDNMSIIEDAILGQMQDDTGPNLSSVGHRRWLLKPSTSTMGIGSALLVNRGGWNTAYTAVRIMNRNSNPSHQNSYGTILTNNSIDYDFVAWPASGFMLNETFDSNTPWSIHINENRYQQIPNDVQVEIIRQSDGARWIITNSDSHTYSNQEQISGKYFKISNNSNTSITGEGHTLIFCPNPNELGSGKLRDDFDVKITGLKTYSGASKTIEYTVKFRGIKPNLDEMNISLNPTSMEYTGSQLKPTATVNYDGTILTEGTDYEITYSNNVNVTNGGANATITGKGNYEGTVKKTFSITPKELTNSMLTITPSSMEYSGSNQKPSVTLQYNNRTLIEGTDYTIVNNGGTGVGSYNVSVTGNGNYTGTVTKQYSINAKPLTSDMITLTPSSFTYNGKAQSPSVTVRMGDRTLVEGEDYTVDIPKGIDVGTYAVTVTAINNNFSGAATKEYTIKDNSSAGNETSAAGPSVAPGNLGPNTPDEQKPDAEAIGGAIMAQNGDGDPRGSTYQYLQLKSTKQTKAVNSLTWKRVAGATSYVVYGNKCGKANKFQKLATVGGTTFKHGKLKKGTYYKYIVVAVKGDRATAISKVVHVATKGNKKANNHKKIKVKKPKKSKATIKRGKTVKIKATAVGKKVKKHRGLCYESMNPLVATVTAKGVVRGINPGKTKIFVYAQNGVSKTVTITVK